jgi:hypothetical protein
MNTEKRSCKLTSAGIEKWSVHNIKPDPRQVFTIEYQAKDQYWIKAWWGESCILGLDMVNEVFWDEALGEYV